MKKIFFSITGLFIAAVWSNAQNTSPYWSLAGNSNATTSSKLGTTNLIPLRLFTNNIERVRINENGRVGIGTTTPVNIFTVKSSGGTPASSWLNGITSPVFVGFASAMSSEFLLAGASNVVNERAVYQGRRSRGTTTAPLAVANNDYITSLLGSAYDGSNFQNPALISVFVDGTPSAGNVPARISLVTGSNGTNRKERLKVGSTGNFDFNGGQVYLQQSTGFLGIGTTAPSQKLHVAGNGLITGSLTVSSGVSSSQSSGTALYGTSSSGYGVYATSGYTGVYGSGNSYGVYGYSPNNYGVFGSSGYTGVYGNGNSYGVYGFSTSNYGVYGTSSNGVGVYGYSDNLKAGYFYSVNENGLWAKTGRGDKNYAGVFEGNVYTFNSYQTSDKNLKKNIEDVGDALNIIKRLKPKTYEFRNDGKLANLKLPEGRHYGILAQDLQEVLPNLVREVENEVSVPTKMNPASTSSSTPDGNLSATPKPQMETAEKITIKAVNYTELIPVIIKAIQELSAKNEALQNELTELKSSISKGGNGSAITSSTAFLRQNAPNPFNNNTLISYYIPDNAGYAQIKITDIKGSVIRSFNTAKGEGQINIQSGKLPAGTYNYTLYINNKTIDTKQMVLLK